MKLTHVWQPLHSMPFTLRMINIAVVAASTQANHLVSTAATLLLGFTTLISAQGSEVMLWNCYWPIQPWEGPMCLPFPETELAIKILPPTSPNLKTTILPQLLRMHPPHCGRYQKEGSGPAYRKKQQWIAQYGKWKKVCFMWRTDLCQIKACMYISSSELFVLIGNSSRFQSWVFLSHIWTWNILNMEHFHASHMSYQIFPIWPANMAGPH